MKTKKVKSVKAMQVVKLREVVKVPKIHKKLGSPITTLKELCELADRRKSVYVKSWSRSMPAAWLQNQQGRMLFSWMKAKMLLRY